MKVKKETALPQLPAREGAEERGTASGRDPGKKFRDLDVDPSRTSVDPLYATTDKYRRVLKPLKVEDLFKE